MCATCGCSPGHHHDHDHDHHHHEPAPHGDRLAALEARLLARNDQRAAENRGWLRGRGVLALNLVSSPGAGKTRWISETARRLGPSPGLRVIVGDQETDRDAARLREAGCRAHQINTGSGCHLDADMVAAGLEALDPPAGSTLLVENVGNLVCPSLFDLGELTKVALLSVTEGEDKPAKYPHMFRAAGLVLVTKVDLLPHLEVDMAALRGHLEAVNPEAEVLEVSAVSGQGMDAWLAWLEARRPAPLVAA